SLRHCSASDLSFTSCRSIRLFRNYGIAEAPGCLPSHCPHCGACGFAMDSSQRSDLQTMHASRYEQLVQTVADYAIYMLDLEGHVVSWNLGAQRIKGYNADEVIGRHFSMFFTPQDCAEGRPGWLLNRAL